MPDCKGGFEGRATGPRIHHAGGGAVKGVDYLRVRADGRFELHIHAEIATDDGCRISLEAGGVCLPKPGSQVAGLRESVTLFSSAKEYAWVNGIQVWGTGTVDLGEGVVRIRGYVA